MLLAANLLHFFQNSPNWDCCPIYQRQMSITAGPSFHIKTERLCQPLLTRCQERPQKALVAKRNARGECNNSLISWYLERINSQLKRREEGVNSYLDMLAEKHQDEAATYNHVYEKICFPQLPDYYFLRQQEHLNHYHYGWYDLKNYDLFRLQKHLEELYRADTCVNGFDGSVEKCGVDLQLRKRQTRFIKTVIIASLVFCGVSLLSIHNAEKVPYKVVECQTKAVSGAVASTLPSIFQDMDSVEIAMSLGCY